MFWLIRMDIRGPAYTRARARYKHYRGAAPNPVREHCPLNPKAVAIAPALANLICFYLMDFALEELTIVNPVEINRDRKANTSALHLFPKLLCPDSFTAYQT